MVDREIRVVIPSDEEIARLKEFGIDIESHLIKAFAEELHGRLHPDEEKVMN